MKYFHEKIEAKWQAYWAQNQTFKAQETNEQNPLPKYYVLDMFPYPSGAGLHVGHPLGYIASDIVARYKRHKGFNVLHPQGYDSFGLPAEQYAIQTGQHPEKTTRENIARYREQLDKIGFSFDWSREVRTSNPDYYKHNLKKTGMLKFMPFAMITSHPLQQQNGTLFHRNNSKKYSCNTD
jgi:leucyl-tRNA synthetase